MARPDKLPATAALRVLRAAGVRFDAFSYEYIPQGGTRSSSAALGVPEHAVIKTLIMETDSAAPLAVLMHGDLEVSTKTLARLLGVKRIAPCAPATADRHSGYQVGGTSPFGLRRTMPIYMERSILDLDRIWINGGRRGLLVALDPADAARLLSPTLVDAAQEA